MNNVDSELWKEPSVLKLQQPGVAACKEDAPAIVEIIYFLNSYIESGITTESFLVIK